MRRLRRILNIPATSDSDELARELLIGIGLIFSLMVADTVWFSIFG